MIPVNIGPWQPLQNLDQLFIGGQPRLDFLFMAELTLAVYGIPDRWSPNHRVNLSHLWLTKVNILDELNSA